MNQPAPAYKWVTVGGVPVNAETAEGVHYVLAWRRIGDYQYRWEVTDMMRPVASGVARNRPQARKHAEEAAREWGDYPGPVDDSQQKMGPFDVLEEAAPWRRVYRDVRADVPVSASVREDNPSEPYALEIGDMRLSMSEATLIAVAAACDELVGESAALSDPFSTSNRKGNGLLNPAQSAD